VLAYSHEFNEVLDAISAEKKLKGWSHAKKSALARGDWRLIQALSKSKNYRPPVRRPRTFS
jgi:predicted GIY-YIG superfamily endonuclease